MAGPALAYDYHYRFQSYLEGTPASGGANLRLATCSAGAEPHPYFFEGRLVRPGRAAELLRSLVEVVQSRFHIPAATLARILALADPIVTGSGELLRFEGFSACCSTYGRVDFLPEAIDGTWHGRGTTNVDFNAPMRAALARVRDSDRVGLAVGSDLVNLSRGEESVVGRKARAAGALAQRARGSSGVPGTDGAEARSDWIRGRAVLALASQRLGDNQRSCGAFGARTAAGPGGVA